MRLVHRTKYIGASLRDKVPFLPKPRDGAASPPSWDASRFARACSEIAANRQLDARAKALANRLLVEADAQGFALKILADPVEAASTTDWRQRYALSMSEVLHQVEKQRTEPTGPRRYFQAVLGLLADWAPPVALVCAIGYFLLKAFNVWQQNPAPQIGWLDLALPIFVTLAVLIVLHVLIALLLPLRWSQIRGEIQGQAP